MHIRYLYEQISAVSGCVKVTFYLWFWQSNKTVSLFFEQYFYVVDQCEEKTSK